MKIEILEPKGYCSGVINAIRIALKAKKEHPDDDVFVLGNLVHNDETISLLKEKGIFILNSENTPKKELIKSLKAGNVLVFPAHGHAPALCALATSVGVCVYDATCAVVEHNQKIMREKLNQGYKVIFVGKKNHPETEAMLSLSDDVYLYSDDLLNKNQISTNSKIFVANQTTLNYASLKGIHSQILERFPHAEIQNEICATTRLRQERLSHLDDDVDLIIIVGSDYSNNTKELYSIAYRQYTRAKVLLVDSYKKLKGEDILNKNHIVISSGASTPPETVDMIYHYIKERY